MQDFNFLLENLLQLIAFGVYKITAENAGLYRKLKQAAKGFVLSVRPKSTYILKKLTQILKK